MVEWSYSHSFRLKCVLHVSCYILVKSQPLRLHVETDGRSKRGFTRFFIRLGKILSRLPINNLFMR